MAKTLRRRPPTTLTKKRQNELKESEQARAQSLEKGAAKVSRSIDHPDVGRPAKPTESATREKGVDDVS